MAIVNGRRINVPDSGIYGNEVINQADPRPGRRVIVNTGGTQFETVNSAKHYSKQELLDRWGNPVKVTTIPERVKGISYGGLRSPLSTQLITEQVFDIAEHFLKRGVDFDEANADWVIAPRYKLPPIWHPTAKFTPLLIVFPTEYPTIPPIGFYLKANIGLSPNGHLYDTAYHSANKDPLKNGWKWYCVYVEPGCWSPARYRYPGDWKRGDNLWTYFQLINEVLASPN